jgi:hypothetical protein
LLAFGIEGKLELLPSPGFSFLGRRALEARIVRAARRLGGSGRTADQVMAKAAEQIEESIHLIDPDLRFARVA